MSNSSGINGPAIFVAQYISDEAPFNTLEGIAEWAARLGYKGIQIPVDERLINIQRAADDLSYCSALLDTLKRYDIQLTELSTHLQGQLIAVHPAYDILFDGFAPQDVRGDPRVAKHGHGIFFLWQQRHQRTWG